MEKTEKLNNNNNKAPNQGKGEVILTRTKTECDALRDNIPFFSKDVIVYSESEINKALENNGNKLFTTKMPKYAEVLAYIGFNFKNLNQTTQILFKEKFKKFLESRGIEGKFDLEINTSNDCNSIEFIPYKVGTSTFLNSNNLAITVKVYRDFRSHTQDIIEHSAGSITL